MAGERGSRAARRGIVGPWDPPPPPGVGGYLDFSGVARPQDVDCSGWWFPLGRYVPPRHPWRPDVEIGLSPDQVNRHTLVVSPTRGGKTTGVIAPWIVRAVEAGYLVVAVDVKGNGDLLGEIGRFQDAQPDSVDLGLVDWDYKSPSTSERWNFLSELDDDGALNAAAEAVCGRPRDADPNRNFHVRDLKWIKGLFELAYDSNRDLTVASLLSLLADPIRLRKAVTRAPGSRGAQRLRDLCLLSDDEFARATQFLSTYLETLNHPGFVQVTQRGRVDMRLLSTARPGLVHVNAPVADGDLSASASGLFLSQFLYRRLASFGAQAPPVLLVLDEAARLQDRIDLGNLLSLAAGAGISVLLAVQDVDQFDEKRRSEILANCGTLVLLGGANPTTTDHVMARLGNRTRSKRSRSESHDGSGRTTSWSTDSESVPVLDRAALVAPPSGRRGAVVLNSHVSSRPVLVDLTRPDLVGAQP